MTAGLASGTFGDGQEIALSALELPPLGGDAYVHLEDNVLFVEIEACQPADLDAPQGLAQLTGVLERIGHAQTLEDLADTVVGAVRAATGMERVLLYRFDPQGHGDVVAESRCSDWRESFLGFSFPAADIPRQARALYLTSRQRFTPARDYQPVHIAPPVSPTTGRPFNIGRCRCRSLSPMHRSYQANLGWMARCRSRSFAMGRCGGWWSGTIANPIGCPSRPGNMRRR